MLSLDNADAYKGLVFSSLKQPKNRDFCMCYIRNILIFSKIRAQIALLTQEQFISRTNNVFQTLCLTYSFSTNKDKL